MDMKYCIDLQVIWKTSTIQNDEAFDMVNLLTKLIQVLRKIWRILHFI